MMEENVEAVKHVLQEQVQRITLEQISDVPVLQIRKETDEVHQLIVQKRISDHVDEHNIHTPSTQFQEQAVQAVRIISQERIWINHAASAVGIKPSDHDTDAPWHNERGLTVQRRQIYILILTSGMPQMECGHVGNILWTWFQLVFSTGAA